MDTKRPMCVAWKQLLFPQKTHLDRHQKTTKHLDNNKAAAENATIQLKEFLPTRQTNLMKRVAKAEIKMVLRMISHNHSYRSMDSLAEFNSDIFSDSAIAKSVSKIV